MLRERYEMLASLDEYVGKYISNEWIRKQVLRQSDEEIEELDRQTSKYLDIKKTRFKFDYICQVH